VIPLALVLATLLSYAVGWVLAVPSLLPALHVMAGFPFMVAALRRGELGLAIARMLLWALILAACATTLSYVRPWQTGRLFLRGEAYRNEMFGWVMTGEGAESDPRRFVPEQAAHAAIFVLAAAASGGVLAMMMGAALMNQMGHYAGALSAASARPILTAALGWHPWAVIRIISFVALGVVLSVPVLSRLGGARIDLHAARVPLVWAAAGLVADVALKSLLAPSWQRLLLRVVGW
jgi:hypothetical protein